MKTNVAESRQKKYTHEGARAFDHTNAEQDLRRSVMAHLLFEDNFYESGQDAAARVAALVPKVQAETVRDIAIEAREKMKLRHIPLFLAVQLAKHKTHRHVVAETLERVIQRPDELTEVLALYAKDRTGTKKLNKLSKQIQKGVARAFVKFNEYQLAKYNQVGAVKLRDALFLSHAKPENKTQAKLWKRLIDGELKTPDTWEVSLSATKGEGKKEAWERLLKEDKLGALALLRNLRNFNEAGVKESLVKKALKEMKVERVLPFRFVSAARYAPQWEPELEQAMFKCVEEFEKLKGKTIIVVDNSGSMYGTKVSQRSELDRSDAACALAILIRELCKDAAVIGFATGASVIPARRGFALRDAIKAGPSGGTNTETALQLARSIGYDRIIVITDEQSHQAISAPETNKAYFINVANYQNGIGYGKWIHIDGWSESVIEFIRAYESE